MVCFLHLMFIRSINPILIAHLVFASLKSHYVLHFDLFKAQLGSLPSWQEPEET